MLGRLGTERAQGIPLLIGRVSNDVVCPRCVWLELGARGAFEERRRRMEGIHSATKLKGGEHPQLVSHRSGLTILTIQ